jgi:hypothetical protein
MQDFVVYVGDFPVKRASEHPSTGGRAPAVYNQSEHFCLMLVLTVAAAAATAAAAA